MQYRAQHVRTQVCILQLFGCSQNHIMAIKANYSKTLWTFYNHYLGSELLLCISSQNDSDKCGSDPETIYKHQFIQTPTGV